MIIKKKETKKNQIKYKQDSICNTKISKNMFRGEMKKHKRETMIF